MISALTRNAARVVAPCGGYGLEGLVAALRALPGPVIGRHKEDAGLRCLKDESGFEAQAPKLRWRNRL